MTTTPRPTAKAIAPANAAPRPLTLEEQAAIGQGVIRWANEVRAEQAAAVKQGRKKAA